MQIQNIEQFRQTAARMVARATELGFQSKSGAPLVIDQMEELLAAGLGYRNAHVARSQVTQASATRDYSEVQSMKAHVLGQVGYQLEEAFGTGAQWRWSASTGAQAQGFDSKFDAVAAAWDHAVSRVLAATALEPQAWIARPLHQQFLVMQAVLCTPSSVQGRGWAAALAADLQQQGFEPEDLDELVHEFVGPSDHASWVNNQGTQAQVEALMGAMHVDGQAPEVSRAAVLGRLQRECEGYAPSFVGRMLRL